MIRDFLNSAVQKKFFLMFFTCVIYIVGLFAYFSGQAVLTAFIIMIVGVFAILKNYLPPKLVLFLYFVFFFAFFNASLRIKNSDALYQSAPQNAEIQGQIVSIPTSGVEDKTKFFFNVSKVFYQGKVQNVKAKTYVTAYSQSGDFSKFNIGNNYILKGKLRTPFEVTNPSQFDYGKYLRNFGAFTVFYVNENDCTVKGIPLSPKWKFLQGLNNIRNEIIQTHAKYLKSPNLEILGGIVFGDDAVAPPDYIKTAFLNSGLLHILAASGMNVALIYGIWYFIMRRLKVPFKLNISSGIFIIIFYALMTGLGPSVIRATFMLIFILLGKLIDRDAHSVSLLSFVAILMLIYNPAYINDVGFQLSFVVTLGLLLTTPLIMEKRKEIVSSEELVVSSDFVASQQNITNHSPDNSTEKTPHSSLPTPHFLPTWLSGAIFIPIIAQIWIAPIQMYYFNSFSLYSVFANIAILPFVTVISFGGFISAVLALIKPLANQVCFIFDFILNPVLNGLVVISEYFSNLPHSLIQMPQPSFLQIALYYAIVLLATLLFKIGKNKKVILATSLLFIALILSCIKIPDKKLETIFFDVQNADAFLIKTPKDKYFLIDSGKMGYQGGKTQAKVIILSYLKDKGVKNIEGFIITHFDSDHAGGAVDLIESLNIKNVYVNSLNDKSNLAQKIYKSAKGKLKLVKNNEVVYADCEQRLKGKIALLPVTPFNASNQEGCLIIKNFTAGLKGKKVENENSIITLVSDRNFEELFMGDAGIVAFDKIKKDLPYNIEVLKVGHHGAKNVIDKSFLDRINPKIAIISTGLNNYGHPSGITLDVLQRYKYVEKDAERSSEARKLGSLEKAKLPNLKTSKLLILRTDRKNAIKIDRDDNNYKSYSYNKTGWREVF